MIEANFSIRTMSRQEVDLAVEWAAEEGWNPGVADAESFYNADNNGFLIGLLDGEPVASISAVKYDQTFGFIGFYIVRPEYRGNGYGMQLWRAALKYLSGCTIGLDGVLEQKENYEKSGFNMAHSNMRYEGIGGEAVSEPTNIVELETIPFETINSYDKQFFPTDRRKFLEGWVKQANITALGMQQNGTMAGYGVLRKCRNGYKIGPLFADNFAFAESLFLGLRAKVPYKETFFLDIPEVNIFARDLVEKYNMKVVFKTARMYLGEAPKLALDRIYGVTSFELG